MHSLLVSLTIATGAWVLWIALRKYVPRHRSRAHLRDPLVLILQLVLPFAILLLLVFLINLLGVMAR